MKRILIFLFLVCFLLIPVSSAVAQVTEQIETSEFTGILASPSALMDPGNMFMAIDQKETIIETVAITEVYHGQEANFDFVDATEMVKIMEDRIEKQEVQEQNKAFTATINNNLKTHA